MYGLYFLYGFPPLKLRLFYLKVCSSSHSLIFLCVKVSSFMENWFYSLRLYFNFGPFWDCFCNLSRKNAHISIWTAFSSKCDWEMHFIMLLQTKFVCHLKTLSVWPPLDKVTEANHAEGTRPNFFKKLSDSGINSHIFKHFANSLWSLIVPNSYIKQVNTLFNIVESWFKNGWTLMSVLYDDVQMDQ